MADPAARGIRSVQLGLAANAALALIKAVAGIVGNAYALVADAVESAADILGSMIVWGGLRVASRDPDDAYPFGYGRAESLAALVVAVMLLGAAVWISVEAVREIRTPHHAPAPWTLGVLVGVLLVKWVLFRRQLRIGADIDSTAVKADAWHHASDAVTSAAAFVGISIALLGGPGWESADDWAALVASLVIAWNGVTLARRAMRDLMDRMPGDDVLLPVEEAARSVEGVLAIEKLKLRKSGLVYHAEIHVQANPAMPLHDAHVLGGRVKRAIMAAVPAVAGVLVHMEPFEGAATHWRPAVPGAHGHAPREDAPEPTR